MLYIQAISAFLIASTFTWIELITSKYSNTFQIFIFRSASLWAYAVIYGLLAFIVVLIYEPLVQSNAFNINGVGADSLWGRAILIGFSTKALLHIRLFTVTSGPTPFPVGTETFIQLFEPLLLRNIELDDYNSVNEFISPYENYHTDIKSVKSLINYNTPSFLSISEKTALKLDIDNCKEVYSALEIYLRKFGKKTFERTFKINNTN